MYFASIAKLRKNDAGSCPTGRIWGGWRDSNPRQPEPQSGVLPLNYTHHGVSKNYNIQQPRIFRGSRANQPRLRRCALSARTASSANTRRSSCSSWTCRSPRPQPGNCCCFWRPQTSRAAAPAWRCGTADTPASARQTRWPQTCDRTLRNDIQKSASALQYSASLAACVPSKTARR